MKKNLLLIILLFCAYSLSAQWVPVNTGLPDYPPTSLFPFTDTMVLSTYGGGVFKTLDNGENWIDINENLGNLFVNDIRGFYSSRSMFLATQGGPYITFDQVDYTNCTSTGLTNTEVNYFWWGVEDMGGDFMVGTNGGGVFASEEWTGPWTEANTGVSGAGMVINDIAGYEGEVEYAVMATDGGTYWANNGATEWTEVNTGLSGDALKVKKIAGLGFFVMIATHGGLYYNNEMADNWTSLIPDEKLNIILALPNPIAPPGFVFFALGEKGFYSEDIFNWTPMDLGGIEGEVTAAHINSTDLFLGFTTTTKSGKGNGGVYRRPLDQILVGIEDGNLSDLEKFSLEQNHPNPFSQSTNISYSLKNSDFVSLKVYDFAGREIRTMVDNYQNEGNYSVVFEAGNLPNGVYTYILQIGKNIKKAKKMVLLK
ncbi:MAG: T9SS type A sorting domain-containing protein [Bacteroidales bacterium]|nr:T9SS type A sorting domain-containing protein [Bacteroidales bacterium]